MKRFLLISFIITSYSFSQTGGSLNFDGVNDYVNITNQTQTFNYDASSTFTIEFLIKPGAVKNQTIIGKGSRTAGKGFTIKLGVDNRIYFRNRDVIIGDINTAIPQAVWSHVAVTYNATAVKIYINGVLKKSGTLSITPFLATTPHKMFIGARRADDGNSGVRQRHFNGTLDELRIWNAVRTQPDIDASKGCALSGSETNLVSYFNFNQGTAAGNNTAITTLVNSDPTYNGTLNGFAKTGATSNFVTGSTSVSGTCTLSNDDFELKAGLKIFPNPSNGQFTIANASNLALKYAVISDINGRQIQRIDLSQMQEQEEFTLNQITSGLYFITIHSADAMATEKLIIK